MSRITLNRCIKGLLLSSILSSVTVVGAYAAPQVVTITDAVDVAATTGTSPTSSYKNTTVGPDGSPIFADTAIAGKNWGDAIESSASAFDTSQMTITRNNSADTITFDMTTEYSGSDSQAPAGLAKYADLFIDTNTPNTPDNFNYAITLGQQTGGLAAGVYASTAPTTGNSLLNDAAPPSAFKSNQYDTSQQLWSSHTGFTYGGYAARDSDLAAYQTAETAYTNYLAALTTYNTAEAAYTKAEAAYVTAEAAYVTAEAAYNTALATYNTKEAAYLAAKAKYPHTPSKWPAQPKAPTPPTAPTAPTAPIAPTVVTAPAPPDEIIPPVRLTSGTELSEFTVTETSSVIGGVYASGPDKGQCKVKDVNGECTYDVQVTVTAASAADLNLFNNFDVFWGTADCSNDAIWGTVATHAIEPGSVFLLGCGLLGLLGLSRRRRSMFGSAI